MNLFESLGLKADPFTTSPNVDLFFPATEHRQCLEGLELAIRMRRGLSVIRGGIGVGKTTISRKLIHNFKSEADVFDFYLILDPKFESELILLKHIIELFSINENGDSVQKCRNIIENYLLRVGVDQGKTLVLVVDEGQNLPEEMLDVFRTLLNFETDDYKLLQLIMFGQPEMGNIIHKYPNFEDRISFDFEIGPLTLADTKGFIEYRLTRVGAENQTWFSPKSIEKIYKNTHGFPRKITLVCHQVLLAMMSEEADVITEDLVQRVISGKANTTGLLQQKKKDYTQVAVNKLLHVLRKDTDGETAADTKDLAEEINDNDLIGGDEPPAVEKEIPSPLAKEFTPPEAPVSELDEPASAAEDSVQDDFIGGDEPPAVEKEIPTPAASSKADKIEKPISEMDLLPSPGQYPPFIPAGKLPFDNTVLGISIDQGQFTMALVQEQKNKKILLAVHTFNSDIRTLSPTGNPAEFAQYCESALESFDRHIELLGHIPKSIVKKITSRSIIALNINDGSTLLKRIQIPKDSQKNRNQIIDWTARKDLTFPSEPALLNYVKSGSDSVTVGVGDKDALTGTSAILGDLEWEIRNWHPVGQAVYNTFRWNYPDHRHHSTLILHMGEQQSLFLGSVRGGLRFVESVPIGIQNLYDALIDQGVDNIIWSNRDEYVVPRSLLQPLGIESESGLYDTIFIPVFETWLQEIDRTLTGIKYNFTIEEKTPLLLSGAAGFIQNFNFFIQGSLNLDTSFMNPLRNLAIAPDESKREELAINPTTIVAAVGSALKIEGTVSIMPNNLKYNEIFRWANRISIPAAAAVLAGLLTITGTTKTSFDNLKVKIPTLKEENTILKPVEQKYITLTTNKNTVKEQLDVLSYDTDLYEHILATIRFLSHSTPKEIRFSKISFRSGWENKSFRHMGGSLIQVVEMEDEDQRVMRLVGQVKANPALKDRYFNNYINTLESSDLFFDVNIVSKKTETGKQSDHMDFELRCFL